MGAGRSVGRKSSSVSVDDEVAMILSAATNMLQTLAVSIVHEV